MRRYEMMKSFVFAFALILYTITPYTVFADDSVATIKIGKIKAQARSNPLDQERDGGQYYMATADKDMQMVAFDFTATSDDKNPALPSLFVAKLIDGKISNIETFEVRFKKWRQYGCYIGLYHDETNDFATTDSVRFTAYSPVPKDGGEYVVFTDGARCYVRQEVKRKRPPVEYLPMGNCAFNPPASLDGMKVLGKVRTAKR